MSYPLIRPVKRPLPWVNASHVLSFMLLDPLSENVVIDESRIGHKGQIIGATWKADGLSFNTDDTIKVPDHPSLEFGTDESFSISLLMKILNNSATQDLAGKIYTGVTNWQGYHVTLTTAGKINFMLHDTTKPGGVWPINITSDGIVDDGEWHTISVVRDAQADEAHIYIDDVLDKTKDDISSLTTANSKDFYLGSRNGGSKFYGGMMSQAQICKRVLDESDIIELDEIWKALV